MLTNNVTMNIQVGFSNLSPNILGRTSTSKSTIDIQALANLQPLDDNGGVNVLVPGYANPATQDGITAGTYDFVGVAVNEIGHALGFLSGAEDLASRRATPGTIRTNSGGLCRAHVPLQQAGPARLNIRHRQLLLARRRVPPYLDGF